MDNFKFKVGDNVLVNGYLSTYNHRHVDKMGAIVHRKSNSQGNFYTIKFEDEEKCLKVKEHYLI